MKVAVLGHHPDLFPGFNALMTANLAYGFAESGLDVTVLLPDTQSHPQSDRMSTLSLTSRSLDQFGAQVEFRVVSATEDMGKYDLGVWQSYFAEDEAFFPAFRRAARIVTKNFPRLLTGNPERDVNMLAGTANRFDIVGLALKEDKRIADSMAHVIPDAVNRSFYMPRGFRSDWFQSPTLAGVPIFGIEKGVDTDSSEYAYLVPVINKLRSRFGQVDVIGARLNDKAITTSTLGLLPARQFYSQFLNPIWAYLMIDVNKSRQSMNAVTVAGKAVYPGMYENQVVEAQMAGAAVIGHQDALPDELIASPRVGLRFDDFGKTEVIFEFLANVIENREKVSSEATQWARENHSVSNMIRPLLEVL